MVLVRYHLEEYRKQGVGIVNVIAESHPTVYERERKRNKKKPTVSRVRVQFADMFRSGELLSLSLSPSPYIPTHLARAERNPSAVLVTAQLSLFLP